MHLAGMILFKALLQGLPQPKKQALVKHLNNKLLDTLAPLPANLASNPLMNKTPFNTYLNRVHVSWITPYLRTLSENDMRLFLAALSPEKQKELKEALLFSPHIPVLREQAKEYLQYTLFTKIRGEKKELLPIECLPEDPLNALLQLKPHQLSDLIFFAGLTDLSYDLKRVVETAKIKLIHAALSARHLSYLQSLAHQRENIAFKPMALDKWSGEASHLHQLIYQRGLNRLAKALYGSSQSLFWYVAHSLDAAQSAALEQLHTNLDHPRGHTLLVKQIVDLCTLIQEKSL